MDCVNCATPIPNDAKFCYNCGSQVSDAEGQARISAGMDASSFAHMEKLLREETTGVFEIDGLLGRGGMAVVYLAHEKGLDRKVAIKVLPPELTFGHGVQRFKREAKTAAALDHPHIIPIYRIGAEGKLFWYAMKFLEGRSLDEVLRERGRMPLDETIEILSQVADALDYAHDRGVIHRDIKPANVMLDSRNRVIVTDFGIAKAMTEQTLTASGSVVGTPYYMSPEQGMGKQITGAADQYSVSVMAYRMLSGQVPFEGDSAIDILHKHCMITPPPLEIIQSGLPRHVYKAVHKALEKKAEARFKNVASFVRALRAPTPETDSYPDIQVAPDTHLSASDVATVVMPSQPAMPTSRGPVTGGVSAEAATQITPPSGELRPPPSLRTGTLVGAAAAQGGMGKWIGIAVGVAAVAGVAFVMTSGGDDAPTTQNPPVQQQPAATPQQQAPPPQTTPQQAPAQPAATTGRVEVIGAPSGATILVNGRQVSGSSFELEQGGYDLEIRVRGYENFAQRITVIRGRTETVAYNARVVQAAPTQQPSQPPRQAPPQQRPAAPARATMGELRLRFAPAAEQVTIDGADQGPRSTFIDSLSAGPHKIVVRWSDGATKDTTITIIAGDRVQLVIRP